MSSARAIKYAENRLGVHEVYDTVEDAIKQLDSLLADLDKAQDSRRKLDDEYADREVEMIGEKRGMHPSMSDTRFKSEMRIWEREDPKLSELRSKLSEVRGEIQGLEYDAEILRHRIKAGSSRMEELGGYLNYLAAVRSEQTQAETTNKEEK